MIIRTGISDKLLKTNRILNTIQDIHVHGANCGCHSNVLNNQKRKSIIPSIVGSDGYTIINDNNDSEIGGKTQKLFLSSKPIPFGRMVENNITKIMDANYYVGADDRGDSELKFDNSFEMSASSIRFGPNVTYECAYDLQDLGCKNVAIFTDSNLLALVDTYPDSAVAKVLYSLKKLGDIKYKIYSDVSIEPTDKSFKSATEFMESAKNSGQPFDGIIAVGGGSVIDTAKAANLYSTYPTGDFLDYVNTPIGKGYNIPGNLKPLIAIPTTCGTGSELTGIAVFDLQMDGGVSAKTGIANRRLKPTIGLVDPENLKTIPVNVAISSAFDQLCHAMESFTTIPFNQRSPRPNMPSERPSYQGANPISDTWSLKSLEMLVRNLPAFIQDPRNNHSARSQVMMAASLAGFGFGNSGVHLPHGMSYSISSMVKDYKPEGYFNLKKNLIPHGQSVVLGAPAVFKFTAPSNPERHLLLAKILGADISNAKDFEAGPLLSQQIIKLMKQFNVPNGLEALGYKESDIDQLVKGTFVQHRVTKLMPKQATMDDLHQLFKDTMRIY